VEGRAHPKMEPMQSAFSKWSMHSVGYHLLVYGSVAWMFSMLLSLVWHVWIPLIGIALAAAGIVAGVLASNHLAMCVCGLRERRGEARGGARGGGGGGLRPGAFAYLSRVCRVVWCCLLLICVWWGGGVIGVGGGVICVRW
jgi:hypothetical protein